MEYLDLYDQFKTPLKRTAVRGAKRNEGEYHFVIHVCIFNNRGEMLIQQRNSDKKLWADLWDVSCSGVPISGESSNEGAQRELKEELGLDYNFNQTRPMLTTPFELGFSDYYLIHMEVDPAALELEAKEVQNVQWASLEEIRKKLTNKEFVPYVDHFIDLLFTMSQTHTEIEP